MIRKVSKIIKDVKKKGDKALIKYTKKFDGVRLSPDEIEVSLKERRRQAARVDKKLYDALKEAAENIERYSLKELEGCRGASVSKEGIDIEDIFEPVESAGLYVPGGRYSYPSSVLMGAVPARVAGVKKIVMVTPPGKLTPGVLSAAEIAGVDRVYRVGGAQAVAALAYGTQTVYRVDFIAGPGNSYVQKAKVLLSDRVGIDMFAGPSEVAVIADEFQDVNVIVGDLAAQAEHSPDSRSFFFTFNEKLLEEVRKGIPGDLASQVNLALVKDIEEAVEEVNLIAPEHLQLMCMNDSVKKIKKKVRNAGAVFVGENSPVALGDYWAGPSHTLPTGGAAKYSEGLGVRSFLKRIPFIKCSKSALKEAGDKIMRIAEEEGMKYHSLSVKRRVLKD